VVHATQEEKKKVTHPAVDLSVRAGGSNGAISVYIKSKLAAGRHLG